MEVIPPLWNPPRTSYRLLSFPSPPPRSSLPSFHSFFFTTLVSRAKKIEFGGKRMLTNPVLNEQKLSTTVCVEIIFVLGWSSLMERKKKKKEKKKRREVKIKNWKEERRIEGTWSHGETISARPCVYTSYNFIFAQPLIVFVPSRATFAYCNSLSPVYSSRLRNDRGRSQTRGR